MSRAGVLLILIAVLIVAAVAGLFVMSNSVQPPQRQVQGTVPDAQLPK